MEFFVPNAQKGAIGEFDSRRIAYVASERLFVEYNRLAPSAAAVFADRRSVDKWFAALAIGGQEPYVAVQQQVRRQADQSRVLRGAER